MGFWEPFFFWVFAVGALVTSVGVLSFRNPLYSALSLIADFFCFAGLYVLLSAHFLAVTQVLVYAGAIMVLFVFIIMLLNLSDEELGRRRFNLHHFVAVLAGIGLFAFIAGSVGSLIDGREVEVRRSAAEASTGIQRQAGEIAQTLVVEQRRRARESGEELEPRVRPKTPEPHVFLETPSRIPGLRADLSEDALHAEYRDKLDAWAAGRGSPADGKYRTFRPGREFEMPPALDAQNRVGADQVRSNETQQRKKIFGTVEPISILLVNRFVIPFELTAVLLLAAIFGAVIIAKKRL